VLTIIVIAIPCYVIGFAYDFVTHQGIFSRKTAEQKPAELSGIRRLIEKDLTSRQTIFALVSVFLLVFAWRFAPPIWTSLQIMAYRQTTTGTVIASQPRGRLEYEYRVDGRLLSGVSIPSREHPSPHIGDKVEVIYSARNPSSSTLLEPSVFPIQLAIGSVCILVVAFFVRRRMVEGQTHGGKRAAAQNQKRKTY
jgi:hypothetical protein